ncbi:MAG: 3-dehydroquinate synthase [Oscillospiraceae bacterium]|nr:3-dehydroquinate synthase [Oscillospiraceae bacterium]
MQTITIKTPSKTYPVHIGMGIFSRLSEFVPHVRRGMLVTDSNVDRLYGDEVLTQLRAAGIDCAKFVFPAGENSKNIGVYSQLLDALATAQITRADALFALGGGVTGDLAGFAAASFLRGISFVQIPTTLLAMVDSSVGGKTGVNLSTGKNLAGAFWQPEAVICDTDTLKSLPGERLADGLSEMLKHGMIADNTMFHELCQTETLAQIAALIPRNVEIKAEIVASDEREQGKRALLNFGHTLAHAIEKRSGYTITHGHAVGLGMLAVTRAAESRNLCQPCCAILEKALKRHNLPVILPYPMDELMPYVLSDKKRASDFITLVLPKKIGECVLHKMPISEITAFFEGSL